MDISAESNAHFIAFRRLVYSLSHQLSQPETQALVYIRLYKFKEKYKDSTALEVLVKLETEGVFSPNNPEGLIEVAKDLKRQDLVGEVKDFVKKRSKKAASSSSKHTKHHEEWNSDEDLHLKATFEVTLAQATVLMQQVEILERALAGGKEHRKRAEEAIKEASQTATTLAERLRRAQKEMGMGISPGDSTSDSDSPADSQRRYIKFNGKKIEKALGNKNYIMCRRSNEPCLSNIGFYNSIIDTHAFIAIHTLYVKTTDCLLLL